jgi:hypothetical protein
MCKLIGYPKKLASIVAVEAQILSQAQADEVILTLIQSFASSLFFSLFSSDRVSASSEKVSFVASK